MTDGVSADFSEVDALALDLARVGPRVTVAALAVVRGHAKRTEAAMKQDFTGHRYAPNIPQAIDSTVTGLSVEVGVNKAGPQGPLGNILAFGTSNNAAVVDHTAGQRRELPKTLDLLTAAGVKSFGF